jgi:hypothetical protein
MNFFPKLFFVIAMGFTVACGLIPNGQPTPHAATDLSDSRIQAKFPGYTLTEYQAGEALYLTQCNRCHTLHPASILTEDQWNAIIPVMAKKANQKAGGEVVTEDGQQALYRYLFAQGMRLEEEHH